MYAFIMFMARKPYFSMYLLSPGPSPCTCYYINARKTGWLVLDACQMAGPPVAQLEVFFSSDYL